MRGTLIDALILTCIVWLVVFWRLGDAPMWIYDESRLANNAVEMLHRPGLVTYYQGDPDLWNTKPPLQIWLMAGTMALLGVNELALRLGAAFAALGTVLVTYGFTRARTGSRTTGLAGAAILLGMGGFVSNHAARSGDYDSLLTLCVTVMCVATFHLVEAMRAERRLARRWLWAAAGGLAAGALAKGIAALLITPGLFLYALLRGTLWALLRRPTVWAAIAVAFAVPAAFYLAREAVLPGYLQAVWENELGGRFGVELEGHGWPWYYYLRDLTKPVSLQYSYWSHSIFPWSYVALVAIPAILLAGDRRDRVSLLFVVVTVGSFLVVLSTAETKLPWYTVPAAPLVASLIAIAGGALVRQAATPTRHAALRWTAGGLAVAGAALIPVMISALLHRNLNYIENGITQLGTRSTTYYARMLPELLAEPGPVRIVSDGYSPGRFYWSGELFYAARLRAAGLDARVVASDYVPEAGERLIWCSFRVLQTPAPVTELRSPMNTCVWGTAVGGRAVAGG